MLGRGIAESSFHHFVDYNWDTEMGCPSFLEEPPGDGYKRNPQALEDIKTYVRNAYGKVGAANRSQAVGWAIQHGFGTSADDAT